MRLKSMEGPLAVHNGNTNEHFNSPKRLNINQTQFTINSNIIAELASTTTSTEEVTLEQWCVPRDFTNNLKNQQNLNTNLTVPNYTPTICSSPDDSLDYEETHQSNSSLEGGHDDEFDSDCEPISEENINTRGIVNPNYPGFQKFAHALNYAIKTPEEAVDLDEEFNNNIGDVNRLDSVENIQKVFYDKPVFNIPPQEQFDITNEEKVIGDLGERIERELQQEQDLQTFLQETIEQQLRQAIDKLNSSDLKPSATKCIIEPNTSQPFNKPPIETKMRLETENHKINLSDAYLTIVHENLDKLADFNANSHLQEKQVKKCDPNQQFGSLITVSRNRNRHQTSSVKSKKSHSLGFDVYNIETAMPKIDLDAIENHLKAAREEERRRRTDREEIRRRLAMGAEEDYFNDRPGRKPSLQARLQSGMNLQICFMNETASDTDSPSSDSECPMTNPKELKTSPRPVPTTPEIVPPVRPATLSIGQPQIQSSMETATEANFFTKQARLQTEARMALAQAKEMARMQMEIERQRQVKSPITEMVRNSLQKVGIAFPEERRRLSRQILTEMNVAQLQVIVNDLHTQIETLNEVLVKFLMERDDLHMEQDSMLVDIEDLTRYLGAKEQNIKHPSIPSLNNNTPLVSSSPPRSPLAALNSTVKPHLHRIASLVKK